MPSPVWWSKASVEEKEQAIRVLNKQASSLGPVSLPPIPKWDQRRRGVLFGDDLRRFGQEMRKADEPLRHVHEQWEAIEKWQNGSPLPSDVRRCRYEACKTPTPFFLVRASRSGRVFCSPKCARGHHATLCMRQKIRTARERKLRRLRNTLRNFRGLLNWKERAARKARVTQNFVTYAIRLGEITAPKMRGDR
jgi:hypothetical protein